MARDPEVVSWREILALPLYLVGGCVFFAAMVVLIVSDKVAGKAHSRALFL